MKKVDIFAIKGLTSKDDKTILDTNKKGIKMTIDDFGRIFNEGTQYIADGKIVEAGDGIGARSHGGARKGSGRKKTGRKRYDFYITDTEAEAIRGFIEDMRKG